LKVDFPAITYGTFEMDGQWKLMLHINFVDPKTIIRERDLKKLAAFGHYTSTEVGNTLFDVKPLLYSHCNENIIHVFLFWE
jgi:hypothetical protein